MEQSFLPDQKKTLLYGSSHQATAVINKSNVH